MLLVQHCMMLGPCATRLGTHLLVGTAAGHGHAVIGTCLCTVALANLVSCSPSTDATTKQSEERWTSFAKAAATASGVVIGFDALVLTMVCSVARYILWAAIVSISAAMIALASGIAMLKCCRLSQQWRERAQVLLLLWHCEAQHDTTVLSWWLFHVSLGLFYVAFFCEVPLLAN